MVIWVLERTLKEPLKNIGIENFTKEIIHVFDNEFEMNVKESLIVTEEFCGRQDTYNICPGGKGGFGFINCHEKTKEWKSKGGNEGRKFLKSMWKNVDYKNKMLQILENNRHYIDLTYANIKLVEKYPNGVFYGKTHSEETKKKMSKSSKGQNLGEKNGQYGTMWITNGSENKKIKKLDSIPEGWYKGRKLKIE